VKITHEHDQFLQQIQPLEIDLVHSVDDEHGDFWAGRVELDPALAPHRRASPPRPGSLPWAPYSDR
jgi:hypothetical protein